MRAGVVVDEKSGGKESTTMLEDRGRNLLM